MKHTILHQLSCMTQLTCLLLPCAGTAYEAEWEQQGEIEAGAGYVTADEFRFGRFTGLTEEEAFAVLNADIERRREDAAYQYLEAENLGIDSRYFRTGAGIQGRYGVFFEYDQLPNNLFDTARTPFRKVDSDRLKLPNGWVTGLTTGAMTQLDASLQSFDIETERKRYTLGAHWRPVSRWTTAITYKREDKDGLGVIGGPIGAGFGPGAGGVKSSILPEPIDWQTDQVDAIAEYARGKGQLRLAYHYSGFDNANRSLTWDNPFTAGGGGGGGGGSSIIGRLALAPDNQLHQLSFSGGYQLQAKTRLSGSLSIGWLNQDESFLPATANPALASPALPRDSLDADAWITNAFVRLHGRPIPRLRLTGTYRYYERDLDVDRDNFTQVVNDGRVDPAQKNRPFDYHKHDIVLDSRYRLSEKAALSLRYDYDSLSRSYDDVERDETDEHTGTVKLKFTPTRKLTGSFYAARSKRDGSDYEPLNIENPLLRKYNLADRDRDSAGMRLSYAPLAVLSLTANAEYRNDDYEDTTLGLTDAEYRVYSLEASYSPLERFTAYAGVTWEAIDSNQRGNSGTENWRIDLDDRITTFTLGVQAEAIPDRLQIGADYVFSDGDGATHIGSGSPSAAFPDLSNRLHSLRLHADYSHSKRLDFRFALWHERFRSDDWALDNVDPDTVPTVLLTGEDSPNYTDNVIMLSTVYKFGK